MSGVLARVRGGVAHRARRLRGLAIGTLYRVATRGAPLVALTFDDGPDPESTPRVLELLARHGAGATFFMVGRNAERHADLVARVAREGHVVGNHTHGHRDMPALSYRRRRAELAACSRALGEVESPLFRPPKGLQSPGSYAVARLMGYQVVGWSAEIEDWRSTDGAWLEARLRERIYPGCIVDLHDSLFEPSVPEARDRGPLLAALDGVLAELGSTYRFVTVPELLEAGEPVRVPWFVRTEDDWATFGSSRRERRKTP